MSDKSSPTIHSVLTLRMFLYDDGARTMSSFTAHSPLRHHSLIHPSVHLACWSFIYVLVLSEAGKLFVCLFHGCLLVHRFTQTGVLMSSWSRRPFKSDVNRGVDEHIFGNWSEFPFSLLIPLRIFLHLCNFLHVLLLLLCDNS